jgi:putative phage-type endonuclease
MAMALTTEQLAVRKVGGSDVATILGLNTFKTQLELYHEKRGTLEIDDLSDNPNIAAGNLLEDGIADLAQWHLTRRWNREVKLRRSNVTKINPSYDWITIHIDRDVVGEDRGVELKNVGARAAKAWGEQDTDEIPTYYLPQVHTYMLVMDYPVWTVAAYFGGGDMRIYEVARDPEWDALIVERTRTFWQGVLDGTPPQLDFTNYGAVERVLKRLYPGTDGSTVQATEALDHWFAVMLEARDLASEYKAAFEGARLHLLHAMKNAAIYQSLSGMRLVRKKVQRKGYSVADTEFIEARIEKGK